MSTRAHYHPRGIDIDLADLSRELYSEIVSLHGQTDRAAPALTCLGNGEPMYVYRHHTGRYFARHYPGGNPDGHEHRIATMSDEHRRQAEYTQRAASESGFEATLEKSTGNGTRLDVAVFGAHNIGFEIQRSGLSRAKAKSRAVKSFAAGFPTAWVTDQQIEPDWANHVPTARLVTRGGWDESIPPRNTAWVMIGDYRPERDSTRKSGWAYLRTPKRVLLDELAYLMPAGEIVPVAVGTVGKVDLAYASATEVIDSCTYRGASLWRPSAKTPRKQEAAQRYSVPCAHTVQPKPHANGLERRSPVLNRVSGGYTLAEPTAHAARDSDYSAMRRSGFKPPIGPGRCRDCGFHIPTQDHRDGCPRTGQYMRATA